jgi:hypothetical protein
MADDDEYVYDALGNRVKRSQTPGSDAAVALHRSNQGLVGSSPEMVKAERSIKQGYTDDHKASVDRYRLLKSLIPNKYDPSSDKANAGIRFAQDRATRLKSLAGSREGGMHGYSEGDAAAEAAGLPALV